MGRRDSAWLAPDQNTLGGVDLDGDDVVVPDQLRDRRVSGLLDHLGRLTDLPEDPLGNDRDAVGEAKRLIGPMGHVDHGGRAIGEHCLEVVEERLAGFGVQPGSRLVEQEHAGFESKGAREAHPLRLAARQRQRLAVREVRNAQAFEGRERLCSAGGTRRAAPAQGQLDVAQHAGGEQARALRGVSDAAPDIQVGCPDGLTIQLDAPGGGRIEARKEAEKRRLAGPVRTEHRQPLPGLQVEPVDREYRASAADVPDVPQLQDCAHAAARCCTEVSRALMMNASASRIAA